MYLSEYRKNDKLNNWIFTYKCSLSSHLIYGFWDCQKNERGDNILEINSNNLSYLLENFQTESDYEISEKNKFIPGISNVYNIIGKYVLLTL